MSRCAYKAAAVQHTPDIGGMCGGCNRAWYCCREHQVADWKRHRTEHAVLPVPVPHSSQLGQTTQSMAQQQLIGWPMMLGTQVQQQGFELFKVEMVTRLPLGDYVPNNSRLVVLCLWRCLTKEQKAKRDKSVHEIYARADVPDILQHMHDELQSKIEDDDAKVAANQDSVSDRSMAAQLWRLMHLEERQFYIERVKNMPPVAAVKTPSSSTQQGGPAKKRRVEAPPPSESSADGYDSSESSEGGSDSLDPSSYSAADSSVDEEEEKELPKEVFENAISGETRIEFYHQLTSNNIENPLDARWKQIFYEDIVSSAQSNPSINASWQQVKTGQVSAPTQYRLVATHLANHMANIVATYTCGPVTEEIYDSDDEFDNHEDEHGRIKYGIDHKITDYVYALDWELEFQDVETNTLFFAYFACTEYDFLVARSLPAIERMRFAFVPIFEGKLRNLPMYKRVHLIREINEKIRRDILQDSRNSRVPLPPAQRPVYFWKGVEELLIEKKHLFAEFFLVLLLSGARNLKLTGHNDSRDYSDIRHPLFETGYDAISISFANEMHLHY